MEGNVPDGNAKNKDPKEVLSSEEIPPSEPISIPPAAVAGLLQACGNELTEVQKELADLTGKQTEMITQIGEHNQMLQNSSQLLELKELMENMKCGLEKLSLVRQEMATIQDRSEKLKERAERLSGLRRAAERREEELVAQLDVGGDEQDTVVVAAEEGNPDSTSTPKP
jgi:DNA repair exonuclease SbcCD ATPase subunit